MIKTTTSADGYETTHSVYGVVDRDSEQPVVVAAATHDSHDDELPVLLELLVDEAVEYPDELHSRWFTLEQAAETARALQAAVDTARAAVTAQPTGEVEAQ